MSIVNWSSPERRRSDNSPLPAVANEIYLDIFDYFVPTSQGFSEAECRSALATLALVCRFFCAVCIPRVFETVTFHVKSETQNRVKAQSEWCTKIMDKNKFALSLATYVTTCRFSGWLPPHPSLEWIYSGLMAKRSEAISCFRNLETLHLTNTPIEQSFFISVIAKDSLKSLSLDGCPFKRPKQAWDLTQFRARWINLQVKACTGLGPYEIPLSTLSSSCNLQTCVILDGSLADSIFSHPVQFDQLRELHVRGSNNIEDFLERTPSIVKLHLFLSKVTRPLSPQSLPDLQELSCLPLDDDLTKGLVSRLSLRRLELDFSGTPVSGWNLLQCTNRNLEFLCIPEDIYLYGPLDRYFPILNTLQLTHIGSSRLIVDSIKRVCNGWPSHPMVFLLIIDGRRRRPWLNLQDQHRSLVDWISKAFPHTKTVQFEMIFEWYLEDSGWKIRIIDRQLLNTRIRSFIGNLIPEDVVDFEGTLVNILDKEVLKSLAVRSLLKID